MNTFHEEATGRIAALALLALMLLGRASVARAQSTELNALAADAAGAQGGSGLDNMASQLSAAIQKASKHKLPDTKVLVWDFAGARGFRSEFSLRLADQLSATLTKQSAGFAVIDRGALQAAIMHDKVPQEVLEHPEAMRCYGDELAATIVVEGKMEILSSEFTLRLKASLREDHKKKIFEKEYRTSLTPEDKDLAVKRVSYPPVPERGSLDTDPTAPTAGSHGYSIPKCISCPNPQYSHAALEERLQGTVFLMIRVDPDGSASDISVVKGLPCGLTQQAINTVARWRFKPANGPDARPAAVTVAVEATFRLY